MLKIHDTRQSRAILPLLLLILSAIISSPPPTCAKPNPNPGIIPVNAQYTKLAAEWWQWALSYPVSNSPLFDETGAMACLGDQDPGNIFFLAGVFNVSGTATRNIKVPAGTRLFFPVVNVEWDNVGIDPPFTVAQLYEAADSFVGAINTLHATIDGKPVQDLSSYRAKSNPFCYKLPATDNIYQFFGVPPEWLAPFACPTGFCVCPVVADGYWLLLSPLSVGPHTINFGGGTDTFNLNITYNIEVVPRNQYQGCD
jgi:hypothetical protein